MKVFHLTSAVHGINSLALKRLRISRFADLNDPFELLAADLVDLNHRVAFRETKRALNESKGLICFSEDWQSPLLWGHYADKHTGMALGFEISETYLEKVEYAQERIQLPRAPGTDRLQIDEALMEKLLRTKFAAWSYEKERRLFVDLDATTAESGACFVDFSDDLRLVEVVLGARCAVPLDRIQTLVSALSLEAVVMKARIANRSFKVIPPPALKS